MATVHHTLVNPVGDPAVRARIEVRLLSPGSDDAAYVTETGEQIVGRHITYTDTNGEWEIEDLFSNDLITPENTVYEVVQRIGGFPAHLAHFSIPDNATPSFELADILDNPPGSLRTPISAANVRFSATDGIDATTVQDAIEQAATTGGEGGGEGGAPTNATYLVTTSNGVLSAEVVVGATPGGELGGSWAAPTVDATHSGSSHASILQQATVGGARYGYNDATSEPTDLNPGIFQLDAILPSEMTTMWISDHDAEQGQSLFEFFTAYPTGVLWLGLEGSTDWLALSYTGQDHNDGPGIGFTTLAVERLAGVVSFAPFEDGDNIRIAFGGGVGITGPGSPAEDALPRFNSDGNLDNSGVSVNDDGDLILPAKLSANGTTGGEAESLVVNRDGIPRWQYRGLPVDYVNIIGQYKGTYDNGDTYGPGDVVLKDGLTFWRIEGSDDGDDPAESDYFQSNGNAPFILSATNGVHSPLTDELPAAVGSLVIRDNAGTPELWYKNDSGDDDWTLATLAGGGGDGDITPFYINGNDLFTHETTTFIGADDSNGSINVGMVAEDHAVVGAQLQLLGRNNEGAGAARVILDARDDAATALFIQSYDGSLTNVWRFKADGTLQILASVAEEGDVLTAGVDGVVQWSAPTGSDLTAADFRTTGDGSLGTTPTTPGVGFGVEVGGNNNAHFEVTSPTSGVAYADFSTVNVDAKARIGWWDAAGEFRVELSAGHTLTFNASGELLIDGEAVEGGGGAAGNLWAIAASYEGEYWPRSYDAGDAVVFEENLYITQAAIEEGDDPDEDERWVVQDADGLPIILRGTEAPLSAQRGGTPKGYNFYYNIDSHVSFKNQNTPASPQWNEVGQPLVGADAPNTGGGVAASVGALYAHTDDGTLDGGIFNYWFKTGAGDTQWTDVTSSTRFTSGDPVSAEVTGLPAAIGSIFLYQDEDGGLIYVKTGPADKRWTPTWDQIVAPQRHVHFQGNYDSSDKESYNSGDGLYFERSDEGGAIAPWLVVSRVLEPTQEPDDEDQIEWDIYNEGNIDSRGPIVIYGYIEHGPSLYAEIEASLTGEGYKFILDRDTPKWWYNDNDDLHPTWVESTIVGDDTQTPAEAEVSASEWGSVYFQRDGEGVIQEVWWAWGEVWNGVLIDPEAFGTTYDGGIWDPAPQSWFEGGFPVPGGSIFQRTQGEGSDPGLWVKTWGNRSDWYEALLNPTNGRDLEIHTGNVSFFISGEDNNVNWGIEDGESELDLETDSVRVRIRQFDNVGQESSFTYQADHFDWSVQRSPEGDFRHVRMRGELDDSGDTYWNVAVDGGGESSLLTVTPDSFEFNGNDVVVQYQSIAELNDSDLDVGTEQGRIRYHTVYLSNITIDRTVTLPAIGDLTSFNESITIKDASGASDGSKKIIIAVTGGDLIDGLSSIEMDIPYGWVTLRPTVSGGRWMVVSAGPVFG